MTSKELVSRQMRAGYALLIQSLAILVPGTFMLFNFLSSFIVPGPLEFLIMYGILICPAFIPLALGYRLFQGKFSIWILVLWSAISLIFTIIGLNMTIPLIISGYQFAATWYVSLAAVASLLAALLILHFAIYHQSLRKGALMNGDTRDSQNPQ